MMIQKLISRLSILGLLVILPHILHAAQIDHWYWRNPLPQGQPVCAVAYGNNTFVAGGESGIIFTSNDDGETWTARTSGTDESLYGISYGNGTFVAVGAGGTILTSDNNGVTWTSRTSGTDESLYGISYGNGTFVAVGGTGTILTSDNNGVTWTPRTSGTTNTLEALSYGNGTFVIVGDKGTILTSSDGEAWTSESVGTSYHFYGISYGDGTFVAVGLGSIIFSSNDAMTWTPRTSGTSHSLEGIGYGNGTFVAVGWYGAILTSPDGVTWTFRTSRITEENLEGISYGNGTFIAVGWNGAILTSSGGETWTVRTSGTDEALYGIGYGNGAFVAVGAGGTILTSDSTGVTWTSRNSGTTSDLSGLTYGNGTFVAVGKSGKILTSNDNGVTWTSRTSGTGRDLFAVGYDIGTFVAVGESGKILISNDNGVTWTSKTSGTSNPLYGITYGKGTFVAVGGDFFIIPPERTIVTSPDGVTWTDTSSLSTPMSAISYGSDTFGAVGYYYRLAIASASADIVNWTNWGWVGTWLTGICYGNDTFVAVGTGGTILQSNSSQPQEQYRLTLIKAGAGSGTVTSSPAGIHCGVDCSETYSKVQKVRLTAKADASSTFTGWSGGGCSGTKACTVTVNEAITVTASFALKMPDISVAQTSVDFLKIRVGKKATKPLKIRNNGTGDLSIMFSGLEETDFSIQSSSSVTIKPKKTYSLKVIFMPTSPGSKTATLRLSSNDPDTPVLDVGLSGSTVEQPEQYTLIVTKAGTGSGTVTSNPAGINCGVDCSEVFNQGTSVMLTPAPDSGSTFAGWSGDCSGTGTCTLDMTSDKAATATFTVQQHTLTVTKAGTGSGTVTSNPTGINCGADCSETYNSGTSVTLTATPDSGSTFAGWSGDCSGTGTCTLDMTSDKAATATFTVQQHTLTVTKAGTGSGTVTSNPTGINCGADCSETYNSGTSVTLTATPDSGSTFTGWSGACSGTAACIVNMTSDSAATATFAQQQYTLTVTKAGTGSGTVTSNPTGINCGSDCSETYNQGTSVTMTATPASGSTFGGWSGDGDCSDGAVTMNANKTCTATFNTEVVQYTLTVTKAGTGSGTVTSNPAGINCGADCSETYNSGTSVILTATPDSGSTFTGWSGACSGTGACIVSMSSNKAATATFAQQQYTLTVIKAGTGSGTVTSNPSGINCGADCSETYNSGTSVTLTATPDSGSTFTGWSGACSGTGACIVSMTSDSAATATFGVSYDGTWNGTTSQGKEFSLTILDNGITSVKWGISCGGTEITSTTNYSSPVPITGNTFSLGGIMVGIWDGITNQMHTVTINGTLNSATSASGNLGISGSLCNASATWNATK